MKIVLITGGGGLIGQAIAHKHIAEGDTVYVYDNKSNKYNNYSTIEGIDISDKPLENVIKELRPDIISHQAALVGVGQSQYCINSYVQNNIQFTAYLLQCILDTGIKPIIMNAGSMGPYGYGDKEKTSETFPCKPISIYGVTKYTQEELIRVFSETYNINAVSLRYFSVYSTKQNPLNPFTGVLSVIANQLLNSDKVVIYEDGLQSRDLIEVRDIANAHFIASNTNETFQVYNIGTGIRTPMKYIAEIMRDRISPGKEIIFNGKYRIGDIRHMQADITKVQTVLKWNPSISIEEGINEYCDYIIQNRALFTVGNTIKDEQSNIEAKGLVR